MTAPAEFPATFAALELATDLASRLPGDARIALTRALMAASLELMTHEALTAPMSVVSSPKFRDFPYEPRRAVR